jgi:hypothetical protein
MCYFGHGSKINIASIHIHGFLDLDFMRLIKTKFNEIAPKYRKISDE